MGFFRRPLLFGVFLFFFIFRVCERDFYGILCARRKPDETELAAAVSIHKTGRWPCTLKKKKKNPHTKPVSLFRSFIFHFSPPRVFFPSALRRLCMRARMTARWRRSGRRDPPAIPHPLRPSEIRFVHRRVLGLLRIWRNSRSVIVVAILARIIV